MEIFGLDRAELTQLCEQLGYPDFRGRQIADWLYKKSAHDFSSMTNIPNEMRERLALSHTLTRSKILNESISDDGTAKYLLGLGDGETIESVLLPYEDRNSVCVSTQVGCAVGCLFCATADCGFIRNLDAGEIVDQILTLQERGGKRVSHVVFMGMGEPLLNLDNLVKSIRILNDEVGISERRMTISTVGIIRGIHELAEYDLAITLAVSLHAPNQKLRHELIPIASKYPLDELIESCRDYTDKTRRRITFEYLLIAGINDSISHAKELSSLLKGLLAHVNLIPYNPVPDKEYKRPPKNKIDEFRKTLESESIEVTQRLERGQSVSAACGQLRRGNASARIIRR